MKNKTICELKECARIIASLKGVKNFIFNGVNARTVKDHFHTHLIY